MATMRFDPTPDNQLAHRLKRLQWIAVAAGLIGAAGCAVGGWMEPARFFPAYLVAFLYWVGISLGCLAFLMIHSVTSGRWGVPIQRLLAAGAQTLALMALLFVPVGVGITHLYPWANGGLPADDPLLAAKRFYLNEPFFLGRAVVYFVIWIGLTFLLTRAVYALDARGDERLLRRAYRLGVAGLILYFLTASFAAVDWSMSLQPEWFSSSYGWLAISRQALGALAWVLLLLGLMARRQPFARVLSPRLAQELGMLLLASLLLWGYLAFIQYLVIWYGDLPAEVIWYVQRSSGGWQWVGLGLIGAVFALPLLVLLLPGLKQHLRVLTLTAALIAIAQPVDLFWEVQPVFHAGLTLHWLDLGLWVAMGGLWLGVFFWRLRQHALLPWRHPKLAETLEPEEREAYESARSAF